MTIHDITHLLPKKPEEKWRVYEVYFHFEGDGIGVLHLTAKSRDDVVARLRALQNATEIKIKEV